MDNYKVKTSTNSSRKYPNVMWFPRSKTDPQEIREVLKIAKIVQEENPEGFFNDKTLGLRMASIGSINVVGKIGTKYIESYEGKSIGDVSFITNARMIMRLLRFLGLVTRLEKGKYVLTDLGITYSNFTGDFPSIIDSVSEKEMLSKSLADFAFYSVNDDSTYRDSSYKIRPFIWLLKVLSVEPQCIYQLIVTAFASRDESEEEMIRIKEILRNLRDKSTNLEKEFEKLGLDANNYSCVHNFYDSVKILIYLGNKLGYITGENNPKYGKRIAGEARNLKQASKFYLLTEEGKRYLQEYGSSKLLFYEDLYEVFGDALILQAIFLLAALNYQNGNRQVLKIDSLYLNKCLKGNLEKIIKVLIDSFKIDIYKDAEGFISYKTKCSFNFWQSIPPEIFFISDFNNLYLDFIQNLNKYSKINTTIHEELISEEKYKSFIELTNGNMYKLPKVLDKDLKDDYLYYKTDTTIYGGLDRFASRISPSNSFIFINDQLCINNKDDAFDLLNLLRFPNPTLTEFINANIKILVNEFLSRSDLWEKDQHYVWVRNVFRLFGMEAIYSGSGGMLSRADVSVISPMVIGIEAKSPRENRGSINTKAIRQAVDAKIQVISKFPETDSFPRASAAIGRRITAQAIEEEHKWAKEKQPIILMTDATLYFLSLQTVNFNIDTSKIINLMSNYHGLFDVNNLFEFLSNCEENSKAGEIDIKETIKELPLII